MRSANRAVRTSATKLPMLRFSLDDSNNLSQLNSEEILKENCWIVERGVLHVPPNAHLVSQMVYQVIDSFCATSGIDTEEGFHDIFSRVRASFRDSLPQQEATSSSKGKSHAHAGKKRKSDFPLPDSRKKAKTEEFSGRYGPKKRMLQGLIDIIHDAEMRVYGHKTQRREKVPWTEIDQILIDINMFFTGWPKDCLPKVVEDKIHSYSGPRKFLSSQTEQILQGLDSGTIKLVEREPDRAVLFEILHKNGSRSDSTCGFSKQWIKENLLSTRSESRSRGHETDSESGSESASHSSDADPQQELMDLGSDEEGSVDGCEDAHNGHSSPTRKPIPMTPSSSKSLLRRNYTSKLLVMLNNAERNVLGSGAKSRKYFPWVDLPAILASLNVYYTGWPESCLPEVEHDRVDGSRRPSRFPKGVEKDMLSAVSQGQIKLVPRPSGRKVLFEVVTPSGERKDSTCGFSPEWIESNIRDDKHPTVDICKELREAMYSEGEDDNEDEEGGRQESDASTSRSTKVQEGEENSRRVSRRGIVTPSQNGLRGSSEGMPSFRSTRKNHEKSSSAAGGTPDLLSDRSSRPWRREIVTQLINLLNTAERNAFGPETSPKTHFPWVSLPKLLRNLDMYFVGFPKTCLPVVINDKVDGSTCPSRFKNPQGHALMAALDRGDVKLVPRPPGRKVLFEIINDSGELEDSTLAFSDKWIRANFDNAPAEDEMGDAPPPPDSPILVDDTTSHNSQSLSEHASNVPKNDTTDALIVLAQK